jgi:hypothetical protein
MGVFSMKKALRFAQTRGAAVAPQDQDAGEEQTRADRADHKPEIQAAAARQKIADRIYCRGSTVCKERPGSTSGTFDLVRGMGLDLEVKDRRLEKRHCWAIYEYVP